MSLLKNVQSAKAFVLPLARASLDIVHPCTDYGFKRAFHDIPFACGFLNAVLGLSGTEEITTIRYLDKELPSHAFLGRDFIVDILCETRNDQRFLIEMQNDYGADYASKAFVELCRLVAHWDSEVIHQKVSEESIKLARAGTTYDGVKEFWKDIKTAIVLVVTNKLFSRDQRKNNFLDQTLMKPAVINSYRMTNESVPGQSLCDLDARVVLVMLGNFHKTENELITPLDQWLYAFKDETLKSGISRIPTYKHIENIHRVGIDNNPGLASFYNILNKESVRIAGHLENFEKNMAEVNGIISMMEEKKWLEGKVEGITDMVIKWIKKGKSDADIMVDLEITAERLQVIKDSMEA